MRCRLNWTVLALQSGGEIRLKVAIEVWLANTTRASFSRQDVVARFIPTANHSRLSAPTLMEVDLSKNVNHQTPRVATRSRAISISTACDTQQRPANSQWHLSGRPQRHAFCVLHLRPSQLPPDASRARSPPREPDHPQTSPPSQSHPATSRTMRLRSTRRPRMLCMIDKGF